MNSFLFQDFLLLIIAAFVGGFLARSFKLPSVLGYISSGIIFGILGKQFFASYSSLESLSQLGVSLLLFTLGFELTMEKIKKITPVTILIGVSQMVLTTLFLTPWLLLFGENLQVGILFSILFSFSSTAVIVKILEDRHMIGDFPGTQILTILLLQDLFVIPVIFFLPLLFSDTPFSVQVMGQFLLSLIVPLIAFVSSLFISRLFLSRFLNIIFKYPSSELQLLATIFIAALSIGLFQVVGIPQSISAFLAGAIISEQGKNLATLSQIRPLRDLFLVLFFVMIGMLVSWQYVSANAVVIILLTLVVISTKFILDAVLFKSAKYYYKPAIFSSFELSNVGEFAPVIGQITFAAGLITVSSYNLLLSVFILTLLVTAFLNTYITSIIEWVQDRRKIANLFGEGNNSFRSKKEEKMEDHVIICGHGRIGQEVRKMLDMAEVPYVVLDFDHEVVKKLNELGKKAIYADPTDPEVLIAAGIEKARGVVIALPDHEAQKKIIDSSKKISPKTFILSRLHNREHYDTFVHLGATDIVIPEFEAGIILGEKVLEFYNKKRAQTESFSSRIRDMIESS